MPALSSYPLRTLTHVMGNDASGNVGRAVPGGGTPGGSDTQVQINDSGGFFGNAGLTYNKTTQVFTVGGALLFNTTSTPLASNVADQTITGGANVTALSLSTGNITVDCGARPLQYITNGGAFTITAPANDGSCMLLVTNNGSAGAITFTGFTVGTSLGDALTTTNTQKFTVSIWRINGVSGYRIAAHQ